MKTNVTKMKDKLLGRFLLPLMELKLFLNFCQIVSQEQMKSALERRFLFVYLYSFSHRQKTFFFMLSKEWTGTLLVIDSNLFSLLNHSES